MKRILIEKIKSFIILVLCFTMFAMIANIWDIHIYKKEIRPTINDIVGLISPFSLRINLSGDKKNVFYFDKNDVFKKNSIKIANIIVNSSDLKKISSEDYRKVSDSKSIEFNFYTPINTDYFVSILLNQDKKLKKEFKNIKDIKIKLDSSNLMYIYDGKEAFEFKYDDKINIDNDIEFLKNGNYDSYQYLQKRFLVNNKKNYNIYIPKNDISDIYYYKPIKKFDNVSMLSLKNTKVKQISSKIFGSSLNFVKTAFDIDSSFILMYGYGEKILKFKKDSNLEYISYEKNFKKSKDSIVQDVKIAFNILQSLGADKDDIKIFSIKTNQNEYEKIERTIYFYKILNGYPLIDDLIKVELINSEVVNAMYKSVEYDFIYKYPFSNSINSSEDKVFKILNNIDNFNIFKSDYKKKKNLSYVSEFEILSEIDNFYIAYSEHNNYIQPFFVFVINNISYLIDFNTLNIVRKYD